MRLPDWPFSQRATQKVLTITWACLIPPSVLLWRDSVPWLVCMSAWANFAAHWSAYQGTTPPEPVDDEDDGPVDDATSQGVPSTHRIATAKEKDMVRTAHIIINGLPEDCPVDDLKAALEARLDEIYPGVGEYDMLLIEPEQVVVRVV